MKLYKLDSNPPLYHISDLNCDGKTFIPRIPEDAYLGEEDTKHKRICVSTSIIGCIRAIDSCMQYPGNKWYVHVPVGLNELYESNHVFKPSKNDVPDVQITREKWITKCIKMKCIGVVAACGHALNKSHFRWIEKY